MIEREVGRGGMATVFLAQELHPRRQVAIKVLDPDVATRLAWRRFLREVELLSRLTHPHIVPILTAGETGELLYYVMPYIDGDTLRRRIARERVLSLEEALHIARDVADVLEYAHSRGVIHRDIKPENILLAGGHAVVTDFGVAHAMTCAECDEDDLPLTQAGLPIGTPLYMSPEQAEGLELDGRSDVYSLGCVVYEMLMGEPPFGGTTTQEIMMRHVTDPVPRMNSTPGAVPRRIRKAVLKALAKRPEDRFDSAAQFAEAINLATGEVPAASSAQLHKQAGGLAVLMVLGLAVAFAGVRAILRHDGIGDLVAERVVVAPFENLTGDSTLDPLGSMAANWITQGLGRTGVMQVVPTGTALLSYPSDLDGETLGRDFVSGLAAETGAGTVVWGRYDVRGDTLRFESEITDVGGGTLFAQVNPAVGLMSQPTLVLERLRKSVVTALAGEFGSQLREWARSTIWPPEYDSYQEFVLALDSWKEKDYAGAAEHFASSARLDPTFTSAVLWAARTHLALGNYARADSLTAALEESAVDLPPFDQHVWRYLKARVDGHLEVAYEEIGRAARLSPGSEMAYTTAGIALAINRPREASEMLLRLDPSRGFLRERFEYWGLLGRAYHQLGLYESELDAARQGRTQYRELVSNLYYELIPLAALGMTDRIQQLMSEMSTLPQQTGWESVFVMESTAVELRAHGHREYARELLAQVIRRYGELPPQFASAARYRYGLGRVLYILERWDEALVVFTDLGRDHPSLLDYQVYLGAIASRRGDVAEAQRISWLLEDMETPYMFGRHIYGQARINALLDDWNESVRLLQRATSEGYRWLDAAHVDIDLERMRNFPPFIELLRPRG